MEKLNLTAKGKEQELILRKIEKIATNDKLLVDMSTGEIISEFSIESFDNYTQNIECMNKKEYTLPISLDSFDKPTMQYLYELLEGKMDIY